MSWGIVANVHGDRLLRNGAKVWILSVSGDDSSHVYGLSLGGRKILKWVPTRNLSDFRPKFCAVDEGKIANLARHESKEAAAVTANDMNARASLFRDERNHP